MSVTVSTLLQREKAASDFIPYTIHASTHNVKTAAGDLLSIIKLEGAAHEAADVEDVDAWHESLHGMLRNALDSDIALWRHTVRRHNDYYPAGEFHGEFSSQLNDRYRSAIATNRMMQNDLYLTFVLKAEPKGLKLFGKGKDADAASVLREINERSRRLDTIVQAAISSLSLYRPTRLGCYEEHGRLFSAPMEFLGYLVNGAWTKRPCPRAKIRDVLTTGRLTFGVEAGELRGVSQRRYFAMVSATDYPEATDTGELNALLTVPFEFVLSHSFASIAKTSAMSMVETQKKKMLNTKDAAVSQIDDLDGLLDDLSANRVGMGEHHFSVLVWADSEKQLVERISTIATNLAECGFSGVVREDLALEAAFFAQLPGVFDLRPRPAPITTRNFAGLMALHNFPVGQALGNQWGPAVTVLKTSAGSPFFFNFHLPRHRKIDLKDSDDGEDRVPGHTLIVGPTGSGKTVDQTFLLAQAEKFQPTTFTFDKDLGQEVYIRAQGGQYNVLRIGEPTGWNPFHLEPTPRNIEFLDALAGFCAGQATLTDGQRESLHLAVRGVLSMPFPQRRMARMLDFLDNTEANGPYARLRRWVSHRGESGKNAWVFDNPGDNLSLKGTRHFGFDVTEFLDHDELRTAIVMYLFHRMEALIGTRRFIMVMDEFWRLLRDPYFAAKADDAVRTWRKRDAFAIFGTQGPREVLESSIASSLLDACVTQIFKPAPKARWEDYVDGMKLSAREFEIVKKDMVEDNMRGFLFKQGNASVVCNLNLAGFSDELAVLSSNSTSALISRRAIERARSDDPALWLPIFQQLRRGFA